MRTRHLAPALLVLALGSAPARAAPSQQGASGAQFLKIAPGARPSGMGEAFAAVADDVHAIYFNPAGLGNLRRVEVTGMHDAYFQDINYEYAAAAVPILSWVDTKKDKAAYGVLAASVADLSVSGIEARSVNETDQPTNTFGASDFAYTLAYGYAPSDTRFSLGASAKFIDQTVDTAHAESFAMDAGALYRTNHLSFAGGLRNLGTKAGFSSVADPLPLTLFLGTAYRAGDNWIGSLELDRPRDAGASVALGGEYRQRFADKLLGSVRAGYDSRNADAGGFGGMSFGLGVGYGNLSFDFALVPFGDLGNTYKYSLTAKF